MKKNRSLMNVAYEYIINLILRKEISPGERIQEENISKILGISRTPIREALRKLSNEGIINICLNKFYKIESFDDEFIKKLGIVRVFLDSLAAQLSIHYGSNNDFLKLKELADQCYKAAKAEDIYLSIKKDCDFHLMLCLISNNETLIKFQKELYLKVRIIQTLKYTNIKNNLESIKYHHLIVDKLLERNTEEVLKCIQRHLAIFYDLNLNSIKNVVLNISEFNQCK